MAIKTFHDSVNNRFHLLPQGAITQFKTTLGYRVHIKFDSYFPIIIISSLGTVEVDLGSGTTIHSLNLAPTFTAILAGFLSRLKKTAIGITYRTVLSIRDIIRYIKLLYYYFIFTFVKHVAWILPSVDRSLSFLVLAHGLAGVWLIINYYY